MQLIVDVRRVIRQRTYVHDKSKITANGGVGIEMRQHTYVLRGDAGVRISKGLGILRNDVQVEDICLTHSLPSCVPVHKLISYLDCQDSSGGCFACLCGVGFNI